jgi:RluA family pseudouridine synthase
MKPAVILLQVDLTHEELPLLDYLGILWPDRSKAGIQALFARGAVRSAGRPVSPHGRAGDTPLLEVHADPEALPSIHLSPAESESGVRLLHEDDRIAVLDKPSGVPVVPDRARSSPSCLGFLIRRELQARAGKTAAEYRRERVVHRIDRLTSGVVVMARSLQVERLLGGMFERGEVEKEYLAILRGELEPARTAVDFPILPGRKGKMRAAAEGKPSLTEFEVLARAEGYTLVRARPRTGRTHQIRVHAWLIGHPLAVDPLYHVGPARDSPPPPGIDRLTLHAARIALPPSWPEPREFRSELPADFRSALAALGIDPAITR